MALLRGRQSRKVRGRDLGESYGGSHLRNQQGSVGRREGEAEWRLLLAGWGECRERKGTNQGEAMQTRASRKKLRLRVATQLRCCACACMQDHKFACRIINVHAGS